MFFQRLLLVSALVVLDSVSAWVVPSPAAASGRTRTTALKALDYNDPVVAEEFANVQPMAFEDVEEELQQSGIRVPPTMNDMEAKFMLVEMRLRIAGKLGGQEPKKRPAKFSSKFEEAMWTKPAFAEFYNKLKAKGDHNAMNAICEYLNKPDIAKQRYGKDYKALLRQADEALTAPPPVNTPKLRFKGFPSNMGEQAVQMTLESIGTVVEFECHADEDFPILAGTVVFEDIEAAKKAVAQYNGMNMGMGTLLEMESV